MRCLWEHERRQFLAGLSRLTRHKARRQAEMLVLYDTGCRVGELVALDRTDYDRGRSSLLMMNIKAAGRPRPPSAGVGVGLTKPETRRRDGRQVDHKTGEIKKGKVAVGHRILARVEKDKTGGSRPYEESTFVFSYENGVHDPVEDLFYLGRVTDLVRKDSKDNFWYSEYDDVKVHGKPGFKKWLRKNRAIAEELEEEIRDLIDSKDEPEEAGDDEE